MKAKMLRKLNRGGGAGAPPAAVQRSPSGMFELHPPGSSLVPAGPSVFLERSEKCLLLSAF